MSALVDSERCAQDGISDGTGWHFNRCSRRGTVAEDGKLWCHQHLPSTVKVRSEERSRKWDADFEARVRPKHELDRLRALNADLLAALEATRAYINKHWGEFPVDWGKDTSDLNDVVQNAIAEEQG